MFGQRLCCINGADSAKGLCRYLCLKLLFSIALPTDRCKVPNFMLISICHTIKKYLRVILYMKPLKDMLVFWTVRRIYFINSSFAALYVDVSLRSIPKAKGEIAKFSFC